MTSITSKLRGGVEKVLRMKIKRLGIQNAGSIKKKQWRIILLRFFWNDVGCMAIAGKFCESESWKIVIFEFLNEISRCM